MVCPLSYQNHIGHSNLLQACGNINRVPRDQKISPAELSSWSRDLTCINANAHLQACCIGILRLPSLIESGERCLHIQRGSNCAIGIILVSDRRPENCHYSVTNIFLYGATMSSYLFGHQIKISHQNSTQIFGIKLISQGCRSGNISEHDGHDPSFLGCREPDFAAIQV
jgi:hypothetical protein